MNILRSNEMSGETLTEKIDRLNKLKPYYDQMETYEREINKLVPQLKAAELELSKYDHMDKSNYYRALQDYERIANNLKIYQTKQGSIAMFTNEMSNVKANLIMQGGVEKKMTTPENFIKEMEKLKGELVTEKNKKSETSNFKPVEDAENKLLKIGFGGSEIETNNAIKEFIHAVNTKQ